jgi:hypothetical protein
LASFGKLPQVVLVSSQEDDWFMQPIHSLCRTPFRDQEFLPFPFNLNSWKHLSLLHELSFFPNFGFLKKKKSPNATGMEILITPHPSWDCDALPSFLQGKQISKAPQCSNHKTEEKYVLFLIMPTLQGDQRARETEKMWTEDKGGGS